MPSIGSGRSSFSAWPRCSSPICTIATRASVRRGNSGAILSRIEMHAGHEPGADVIPVTLPDSPAAFADATWEDIAPYYETLASAPLNERALEEWLETWSRLEELVTEAAS